MRLFIAIPLSPALKNALTDLQDQLRRRGLRGRYTSAENLHLTLAFLGEYPDPETVLDAMETVSFTPFSLRLEGIGRFADLWWAGLADSGELTACARRLRYTLARAELPFDRKRFAPHITLARRAVWDERAVRTALRIPDAGMTVSHISLMRSDRGKNGMIYTELGSVASTDSLTGGSL